MFIESVLGKNLAVLDALKHVKSLAESGGIVHSTDEEPATSQPFQRQPSLRCS